MKTIANNIIMIINSQNVKPEHLVISSHYNISFQRRNFVSARMSSREVANTGLPELLLDDLKYLTCVHAATI